MSYGFNHLSHLRFLHALCWAVSVRVVGQNLDHSAKVGKYDGSLADPTIGLRNKKRCL